MGVSFIKIALTQAYLNSLWFIQRNSQLTNQKQGGGTYKLSMESSECDGELDVQYVTINGLKVSTWDYDGDDKEWD